MMRRVCIIRQTPYPWQKNVRRNAETLVGAGYYVDVICLGREGEKRRETMNGVNLHRIFLRRHRESVWGYLFDYAAFFTLAALKLAWLSLRKRYHVVEVDTIPDFLVFITLLPRLLGSKVILYMYENMPALFTSSFKTGPDHIVARFLRLMEKLSASYAHHVIVSDGPPYKKILENHGIPSDKITVILNVPDDKIFDPQAISVSEDSHHFRIVVVSSLLRRYGVETVIRAMPLLLQYIPELRVDIIGDGEYRPVLERMARELKVDGHLNFAGWIRHDDVPGYIARAHVCVAPMNEDVGAPNKLFEYFALGKPAVASALPGLTAMFDGNCIMYFRPGDEKDLAARILELYRSPEKRASLGSCGQNLYRQYQWSVLKQEYLKVYSELVRQT